MFFHNHAETYPTTKYLERFLTSSQGSLAFKTCTQHSHCLFLVIQLCSWQMPSTPVSIELVSWQVAHKQFIKWFCSINYLAEQDSKWNWKTDPVRCSFSTSLIADDFLYISCLSHWACHLPLCNSRDFRNNVLSNISGSSDLPPNVSMWYATAFLLLITVGGWAWNWSFIIRRMLLYLLCFILFFLKNLFDCGRFNN